MKKMLPLTLTPLAFTGLAGCADVVVPVAFHVDVPVDLDAARSNFEADLCNDAASDACDVLAALDQSDDGVASSPPTLPPLLPMNVAVARNVGAGREVAPVDVQQWFHERQEDVSDALTARRFMPLSVPEGVPVDVIADVGIDTASIALVESTLTLDLPTFNVYVGSGYDEDADGNIVGSKDEGVLVAVTAEKNGGPFYFADGGVDALKSVLAVDEPWIALEPQDALDLTAVEQALLRPGGVTTIRASLGLQVPVNFSDIQTAQAAASAESTSTTTP